MAVSSSYAWRPSVIFCRGATLMKGELSLKVIGATLISRGLEGVLLLNDTAFVQIEAASRIVAAPGAH